MELYLRNINAPVIEKAVHNLPNIINSCINYSIIRILLNILILEEYCRLMTKKIKKILNKGKNTHSPDWR